MASFDGFSIRHVAVGDSATDLAEQTNIIERALNDLAQEMQRVRGELSGETATAYDASMAAWRLNLTDMRTLLGAAQSALNNVNQRYRTTDVNEGNRWQAMR